MKNLNFLLILLVIAQCCQSYEGPAVGGSVDIAPIDRSVARKNFEALLGRPAPKPGACLLPNGLAGIRFKSGALVDTRPKVLEKFGLFKDYLKKDCLGGDTSFDLTIDDSGVDGFISPENLALLFELVSDPDGYAFDNTHVSDLLVVLLLAAYLQIDRNEFVKMLDKISELVTVESLENIKIWKYQAHFDGKYNFNLPEKIVSVLLYGKDSEYIPIHQKYVRVDHVPYRVDSKPIRYLDDLEIVKHVNEQRAVAERELKERVSLLQPMVKSLHIEKLNLTQNLCLNAIVNDYIKSQYKGVVIKHDMANSLPTKLVNYLHKQGILRDPMASDRKKMIRDRRAKELEDYEQKYAQTLAKFREARGLK